MRTLAALLTAAVAAAPAWSQIHRATPVTTNPLPPSSEALDRLNLALGWRVQLPILDLRDGIATAQFLSDLVVIQTRSGILTALEPATGAFRWQVRLGTTYPPVPLPVGANSRFVFAANGTRLYQIERSTGGVKAAFDLPNALVAGPAADETFLFVCTGSNMV